MAHEDLNPGDSRRIFHQNGPMVVSVSVEHTPDGPMIHQQVGPLSRLPADHLVYMAAELSGRAAAICGMMMAIAAKQSGPEMLPALHAQMQAHSAMIAAQTSEEILKDIAEYRKMREEEHGPG